MLGYKNKTKQKQKKLSKTSRAESAILWRKKILNELLNNARLNFLTNNDFSCAVIRFKIIFSAGGNLHTHTHTPLFKGWKEINREKKERKNGMVIGGFSGSLIQSKATLLLFTYKKIVILKHFVSFFFFFYFCIIRI